MEARLRCYWWWLNGNVTKEAITRDLDAGARQRSAGDRRPYADNSPPMQMRNSTCLAHLFIFRITPFPTRRDVKGIRLSIPLGSGFHVWSLARPAGQN